MLNLASGYYFFQHRYTFKTVRKTIPVLVHTAVLVPGQIHRTARTRRTRTQYVATTITGNKRIHSEFIFFLRALKYRYSYFEVLAYYLKKKKNSTHMYYRQYLKVPKFNLTSVGIWPTSNVARWVFVSDFLKLKFVNHIRILEIRDTTAVQY